MTKTKESNGSQCYKKGLWTVEEDKVLMDYVKTHGKGKWNRIANKTGLKRCGKSCRLRWMNYLCPNVKRGDFTEEEEDLIIRLHRLLGNRWSLIAKRVPGRTDNQVKNYWNTRLSKKLGIKEQSREASGLISKSENQVSEKTPTDPSPNTNANIDATSSGTVSISAEKATQKAFDQFSGGHESMISSENFLNSFWSPDDHELELSTLTMLDYFNGYFS